uniref:F-box/LRR-repeat protein 15/At3g58940/PEG3-like LRR domain-containing protein n=1 Tax=Aegilops tauschii TaxID=37682 RepID=N1QRA6_AEGTA
MPPPQEGKRAALACGGDVIGALPDPILQHVLSFLPAQATRGLRFVGLDGADAVQGLRKFMDHLLVLRDRAADLDAVEIRFDRFSVADDEAYVNLWTRFAVTSKVRDLTVHIGASSYLDLDNLPLVSQHLRVMNLDGLSLQQKFLDLAGCPALEVLNMQHCDISVGRISSRSLKHLSLRSCRSNSNCWVHVSAPGLASLVLVRFGGTTPFLENMALLETARLDLSDDFDVCFDYDSDENSVPFNKDDSGDSVLLAALSGAKHLELFVFRRDLRQCPTFSKLKTVLLSEDWSEAPDLDALACVLKHSPVLEKLTLQLFTNKGPKQEMKMKGSYSSAERSAAISEHLKVVEVQCNVVNQGVFKVLKFLCAFNIRFSFE